MGHALCMLDNQGYRHTLRVVNNYCFSTAKVVTQTRFNITWCVYCLSCSYFTE